MLSTSGTKLGGLFFFAPAEVVVPQISNDGDDECVNKANLAAIVTRIEDVESNVCEGSNLSIQMTGTVSICKEEFRPFNTKSE